MIKKLLKNFSLPKVELSFACICVLLAFFLILSRLWGGGITGGDDPFTASAAFKFNGTFGASVIMAESQSRFYQLIYYPLAQIPYLFNDLRWTNLFRIFSAALPIIMFFLFLKELVNTRLAFLTLIIYLGLYDTVGRGAGFGSGYNPFHALPLWFNLGMTFIFTSFWMYSKKVNNGTFKVGIVESLFLLIGILSYEATLFYTLIFPLIFYFKVLYKRKKMFFFDFLLLFKKYFYNIFIVGILYLGTYLTYRLIHPPVYIGTQELRFPGIKTFLMTIYGYSFSSIRPNLNIKFSGLEPLVVSFLLLIAFTTLVFLYISRITNKIKTTNYNVSAFGNNYFVLISVLFFVFSPNILFALTPRYFLLNSNQVFYLGSYYSSFALALLISVLIISFLKKTIGFKRIIKFTLIFPILLIFFILSINNQTYSFEFFHKSKVDSIKWKLANDLTIFLKENYLNPKSICTNTLINHFDDYDYWSYYFSNKMNYKLKVIYSDKNICDANLKYIDKKFFYSQNKFNIILK
jgi:hypothetical protein